MIIAEYFLLPSTDSSNKFLYRFKFGGIISPWLMDYIFVSQTVNTDFISTLKKFLLDKYRKMVLDGFSSYAGEIPEVSLNLLKEHEVKLVECDIAPKQNPSGYLKEVL